jgi:ribosomal protein S6--L-glutamate ligase
LKVSNSNKSSFNPVFLTLKKYQTMKILILSRNGKLYSTKRLVEACKQRGHEVMVVDHSKCDLVIEKGEPAIHYKGEKLTGVDAIIPRIGASITFYGTAVVRQFEMCNVFSAVESQAIVRSRDKLRSLQLLSRAGLGMPKTIFTNHSKDVKKVVDKIGGAPLVIKLLEGTQGLGVVLAETSKAAESVIEAFYSLKTRIIIQEFISEAKGADIRAFVVDGCSIECCKDFRFSNSRSRHAAVVSRAIDS